MRHRAKSRKTAGYRSVQSTPIVSREGPRLGVLSTHWVLPHRPSRDILRLFDLYVQQAADFIDRCSEEQVLRESEQRLRALSDIAPGTILWATNPSGNCSLITHGWQDYTGQPAEQALGQGWLEPVHADNRERARRVLDDAAERREPFALDYRLRRTDGEYRWAIAAGRPRYDERGEFLGFVGSVIDAHERKLAEHALRESEAILAGQKEAFQAAMDGRPLAACLSPLVPTAVAHFGNARAAFYMLRSDGPAALRHVTGMSDEYARHVDGFKIGPESLACGLAVQKAERGHRAGRGPGSALGALAMARAYAPVSLLLVVSRPSDRRTRFGHLRAVLPQTACADARRPERRRGFGAFRGHHHVDLPRGREARHSPSTRYRKRTAARTSSWPFSATS